MCTTVWCASSHVGNLLSRHCSCRTTRHNHAHNLLMWFAAHHAWNLGGKCKWDFRVLYLPASRQLACQLLPTESDQYVLGRLLAQLWPKHSCHVYGYLLGENGKHQFKLEKKNQSAFCYGDGKKAVSWRCLSSTTIQTTLNQSGACTSKCTYSH